MGNRTGRIHRLMERLRAGPGAAGAIAIMAKDLSFTRALASLFGDVAGAVIARRCAVSHRRPSARHLPTGVGFALARSTCGARRETRAARPYTSSSSTNVPCRSFGCRNSTGLPWAPVFGSPEPVTRGAEVRNLEAEVVHPARRVAREEGRDRRGRAERRHEFDLAVRHIHEHHRDAVLRQVPRGRDRGAEPLGIGPRRGGEVRHHDGDVVEPPDHAAPPT